MISPEAALLKVLLYNDYYLKYRASIQPKDEKILKELYTFLDKLKQQVESPSFEDFRLYVLSNTLEIDLYGAILDEISKTEVSEETAKVLLEQYNQRHLARQIALKAIEITEGKGSIEQISELLSETNANNSTIDLPEFVTTNLEELYENHVQKHGLRWRLASLNRMFGSLRKGDFGFLFARPETGKTTFLASEATFMASQLRDEDGPIIWFNNEEEGKKVQLRVFQACLGITLHDLFANRARNYESYLLQTRDKLKIVDAPTIDKNRVNRICKEYNPSLIIFDQLDKIRGFDGDRDDLRLGATYQWGRELAKTYCPVIAVSQADATGEGKKWLTMDNVANAKTAKQAEADWILGIGASHSDGFEFVRHLHASKNKLTGDEDSDPALRHGKLDVIIQPEIARYKDYD